MDRIRLLTTISVSADAQKLSSQKPIVLMEQGSFAVGGTMITQPGTFNPNEPTAEGQTYRGDHAYVFYQIPVLQWRFHFN